MNRQRNLTTLEKTDFIKSKYNWNRSRRAQASYLRISSLLAYSAFPFKRVLRVDYKMVL